MHSLYFMHLTNVTPSEEALIVDLWNTLGGDTEGSLKAENLLTLLSAVMSLNLCGIVKTYSDEEMENHYSRGFLHFDENNNLYFANKEDVFKIHQKYVHLSLNRKNRQRAETTESNFSFAPSIGTTSANLAKERTKSQQGELKHHERLLAQGQVSCKNKERLASEMQQRITEGCTFTPQLVAS